MDLGKSGAVACIAAPGLHLMTIQPLLVDALKESLDFVVCKDPGIELVNDSLNGWSPSKLFVHG